MQAKMQLLEICFCKACTFSELAFFLHFLCFFLHLFCIFCCIFWHLFLHFLCILPRFLAIFEKFEALTKPPPKNAKKMRKQHEICMFLFFLAYFFAFLLHFFFNVFAFFFAFYQVFCNFFWTIWSPDKTPFKKCKKNAKNMFFFFNCIFACIFFACLFAFFSNFFALVFSGCIFLHFLVAFFLLVFCIFSSSWFPRISSSAYHTTLDMHFWRVYTRLKATKTSSANFPRKLLPYHSSRADLFERLE